MERFFVIPQRLEDLDQAKVIEFVNQRFDCGCDGCLLAVTVLMIQLMQLDLKTKAEVRAKAGMN